MTRASLYLALSIPMLAQVAPPNSTGVAMGHLHIITPNPDAQKKLWVDVLGGKVVKAGPVEFAMFPGVLVGFRKGDSSGGTEGSVVDHLGFLVRDFEGTKKKLAAAALPVVRDMPDTHQVIVLFPDGIKVEFTGDASIDVPIKHHHVHFATPEIEEMRAWYAKTFGAVPGMRGRFKAADVPGVNLSWNPADKPTIATKGRALDHIGFEVRNLEEFCGKLQKAGVQMEMAPTKRADLGLTIAFFSDPWGTRIELTEGLAKF